MDIAAGNALVKAIGPLVKATQRSGSLGEIGGFGGLFDLRAAGYEDPLLVAATDGVGTKLKLAFDTGRHDTVGIDLVAMCVNDLVVQGAEPLFFLDYFATGRLDTETAASVIGGIAAGCQQAGCALIGGETAEMPGLYGDGEYDLAGFAIGAVERNAVLPRADDGVAAGDVVLGLSSSGLHSNGFSLVRRVVERSGLTLDAPAPFATTHTLGEVLLEPTRIYVGSCLAAAGTGKLKALAHITGGGLVENIPRVLPGDCAVVIDGADWTAPPVFGWLQQAGDIAPGEMALTFNCGIGMIAIATPDDADALADQLRQFGETVSVIGRVVARSGDAVTVNNLDRALSAE